MSSPISRPQAASAFEQRYRRAAGGRSDLLAWSIRHRAQLKPGVYFDLVRHPYLIELYQHTPQRMVIYKASQMGASEYAVSRAVYACDEEQATVIYVFPTEGHISDFSSARIGPAIEASPYLQQIVNPAGQGKRGADRVTLKRVRDRFLYLRGAKVSPSGNAPQLKSIDADMIILDEVDEMDPRAPEIARKRLGHSLLGYELDISTPTYAGHGIDGHWQLSDQREWFVRCGRCGTRQFMTIDHVVLEWDALDRPVAWYGMDDDTAYAACEKCGAPLDRLQKGEWVARYPSRRIAGYHLTKLFSHTADLLDIVQRLQTVDETTRRETYNQDLGIVYQPRGGQITDGLLNDLRRDYGMTPVKGEQTYMGVDVGSLLHVVIRGQLSPNAERKLERPLRFAGAVESFAQVTALMARYNVRTCVVDALPETRAARDFQAMHPAHRVWLAYYTGDIGNKRAEAADWSKKEGIVNVDRTRTLDMTMAALVGGEHTLAANIQTVPDYYAHLKAPVRVVDDPTSRQRSGQVVARYVETGPDHFAHAENYCTVATLRQSWLMW